MGAQEELDRLKALAYWTRHAEDRSPDQREAEEAYQLALHRESLQEELLAGSSHQDVRAHIDRRLLADEELDEAEEAYLSAHTEEGLWLDTPSEGAGPGQEDSEPTEEAGEPPAWW